MDQHHGYLVRAFAPGSEMIEEDRFETRTGAIDCARLLATKGLQRVQCFEVYVYEDEYEESLVPVDYLPTPKTRRQMKVWAA